MIDHRRSPFHQNIPPCVHFSAVSAKDSRDSSIRGAYRYTDSFANTANAVNAMKISIVESQVAQIKPDFTERA